MTDRLKGCYVVFDADYKDEAAEDILNAINMVKGVESVATADTVANIEDHFARERVRFEVYKDILMCAKKVRDGE